MKKSFVIVACAFLSWYARAQVNQGAPVPVKITSAPDSVTAVAFWRPPYAGVATATDGLYKVADVTATSPTITKLATGNYRYVAAVDAKGVWPGAPKDIVAVKDNGGSTRLEWWYLEGSGGVIMGTQDLTGGGGRMILAAAQTFRYSGAPDAAEDLLFAESGVTTGTALVGIWEATAGSGLGAVQSETIAANVVDIVPYDINNDGIKDGLVLAVENPSPTPDQVWILVDDGSPFKVIEQIEVTDGTIGKLAVADFDGDGDDDILIGHVDAASGLSAIRGTGSAAAPFETTALAVDWPLQGSVPVPIVTPMKLDADPASEFVAGFERVCAAGDFNGIFPFMSGGTTTYSEFWGTAPIPPILQAVPSINPDDFGAAQGEYLLYFWRSSQGQFQQGATLLTAPGNDASAGSRVRMFSSNGALMGEVVPYSATMGANVASGNIRGPHPLTATAAWPMLTGPGASPVYGPHLRAFDGLTQTPIAKVSFFAYGTLRYGVKPAAGDIDGDGYDEILTSPGSGAVFGPHVRGFNYDGGTLQAMGKVSFFSFGTLKYGANVAAGDIDGDRTYDEIVAAPGPGAVFGPQVRGFNYDNKQVTALGQLNLLVPFSVKQGGANVGTGDIDKDGRDDVVAGSGPLGPSEVAVATYGNKLVVPVFAPFNGTRGASVSAGDALGMGASQIVAAPHDDSTAPARVRVFGGDGSATKTDFIAFPSSYGARVGTGEVY